MCYDRAVSHSSAAILFAQTIVDIVRIVATTACIGYALAVGGGIVHRWPASITSYRWHYLRHLWSWMSPFDRQIARGCMIDIATRAVLVLFLCIVSLIFPNTSTSLPGLFSRGLFIVRWFGLPIVDWYTMIMSPLILIIFTSDSLYKLLCHAKIVEGKHGDDIADFLANCSAIKLNKATAQAIKPPATIKRL